MAMGIFTSIINRVNELDEIYTGVERTYISWPLEFDRAYDNGSFPHPGVLYLVAAHFFDLESNVTEGTLQDLAIMGFDDSALSELQAWLILNIQRLQAPGEPADQLLQSQLFLAHSISTTEQFRNAPINEILAVLPNQIPGFPELENLTAENIWNMVSMQYDVDQANNVFQPKPGQRPTWKVAGAEILPLVNVAVVNFLIEKNYIEALLSR